MGEQACVAKIWKANYKDNDPEGYWVDVEMQSACQALAKAFNEMGVPGAVPDATLGCVGGQPLSAGGPPCADGCWAPCCWGYCWTGGRGRLWLSGVSFRVGGSPARAHTHTHTPHAQEPALALRSAHSTSGLAAMVRATACLCLCSGGSDVLVITTLHHCLLLYAETTTSRKGGEGGSQVNEAPTLLNRGRQPPPYPPLGGGGQHRWRHAGMEKGRHTLFGLRHSTLPTPLLGRGGGSAKEAGTHTLTPQCA